MKVLGTIRGEKGFALVLSLVVMAAMTAIGIAALTTSTTDMLIARNEKEAKQAFFLAETGIEEAVGRMDLPGSHSKYAGEKSAQRIARRDGAPTFNNSDFDSTGLGLTGTGGSYDVDFSYALEGADTWCNDAPAGNGCSNNEIVLYGQDFGFSGTGVPVTGLLPIYLVDSTFAPHILSRFHWDRRLRDQCECKGLYCVEHFKHYTAGRGYLFQRYYCCQWRIRHRWVCVWYCNSIRMRSCR
jgi:hypothetical protein